MWLDQANTPDGERRRHFARTDTTGDRDAAAKLGSPRSPPPAGADLTVPVVALHGADDPVDRVGIETDGHSWWVRVRDLWQTTRIVDRLLRASR